MELVKSERRALRAPPNRDVPRNQQVRGVPQAHAKKNTFVDGRSAPSSARKELLSVSRSRDFVIRMPKFPRHLPRLEEGAYEQMTFMRRNEHRGETFIRLESGDYLPVHFFQKDKRRRFPYSRPQRGGTHQFLNLIRAKKVQAFISMIFLLFMCLTAFKAGGQITNDSQPSNASDFFGDGGVRHDARESSVNVLKNFIFNLHSEDVLEE